MKSKHPKVLIPGIIAAASLVLAVGVGAQMTPQADTSPAANTSTATSMADHKADMKANCEAMIAKRQEMQVKMQEMDATLDKLVAEMNAAKGSKEPDAMEKPMAAVINELVAQRKASHAMAHEMETSMMGHMNMHGMKGEMDCPMMKTGMMGMNH